MLIKISTRPDLEPLADGTAPHFILFDHVEEPRFGPAKDFDSKLDFDFFVSGAWIPAAENFHQHVFLNPHYDSSGSRPAPTFTLSKRHRYLVNEIRFTRKGDLHRIVFDGVAYICSDEGKTLEKVWAGGAFDAGEPQGTEQQT